MKHCYPLSLAFNPLLDSFQFPKFENKRMLHVYKPEIISEDFDVWASGVGLTVAKVLIFADPGESSKIIHVDGFGPSSKLFGINWNLACDGVIMEWFRATGKPKLYSSLTPYRIYDENECEEIFKYTKLGPVLFDTSTPHCVSNIRGQSRYGVTVRFEESLTFNEAAMLLHNYIID